MDGVPADQGGEGSGGYVVYDNIMVTWLDFEGAAAYTFEVVDNETINVTELESNESGELVSGNTTAFTWVANSDAVLEDTPLELDNIFIGTWESEIPSAGTTLTFDYKSDGTFDYVMEGVPEEEGGVGTGCYLIYQDKQVTWLSFEGTASYTFEQTDENTILVTEVEMDENGGLTEGNTTAFTRTEAEQ